MSVLHNSPAARHCALRPRARSLPTLAALLITFFAPLSFGQASNDQHHPSAPPTNAPPAPAPNRPEIQAATGNAAASLRDQVMRMPLAKGLDVRALLTRTGDDDLLSKALQNAQSVGGPRWVDDHTCQVRLEISGSDLVDLLVKEARDHPERSPLTPDQLRRRLNAWNKMTFYAVGSSAEGESIELATPHYVVGAWSEVDETTRRRTVAAARHDAVHNILGNVSDIPLSPTLKLQDALDRKPIMDRVSDFLNHQPVTRVEYLDDLRVSITLAATPSLFGSTLQTAVMNDPKFSHADIDWKSVQSQIADRVGPTAGTAWATLPGATTSTAAPTVIMLPSSPPDWADTQIESEATSSEGATRLKIARAAEAVATAKLREKFLALKVGKTMLGEAAKADPQLAQAVNRVMMHAHTYKVDYRADGSILVRVSLDLRYAWDELTGKP